MSVQGKVNVTDERYAALFGSWVTARISKRIGLGHVVPKTVKDFLDAAFSPNPGTPENKDAPPEPLGWLVKTIEDPNWPEPDTGPVQPDIK